MKVDMVKLFASDIVNEFYDLVKGGDITKRDVIQLLLNEGIIDGYGNPTAEAIAQGIIIGRIDSNGN